MSIFLVASAGDGRSVSRTTSVAHVNRDTALNVDFIVCWV